jgi:hypothetical protein
MYVLPMEKHKSDLVTITCTMVCNVMLQDCTRHARTLSLSRVLHDSHEVDLRGLGNFTEVVHGTQECVLGERA